ncbi:hypothetical protein [Paenimyroides baculatum]|uniref:Outer membrane protein beta-barrel domain-containing protein n=1 Tax=Paenimyroides baculatum TaxID=2608000 RepID=A0A5M6CZ62_9FLAO|nr:hypothetical protein [Paenimyroides baculatum]KAA5538125.1 hypothetical protein F0460_00550 [Paenimyroides baculatum]
MNKFFTFLLIFLCTNLFAQNKFELGYYIDQSGNKIEGEISEITLNSFPSNFIIRKKGKEETVETSTATLIKYGSIVFEKKSFQYDPSTRMDIANMSKQKEFRLVNKTAFVQLMVNGDIKLYKYTESGVPTFFYETVNNQLTTLKYKKYLENGTDINENKEFLSQLQEVKNEKVSGNEGYYNAVKYNDADLVDYFTKLNGKSIKVDKKSKVFFNVFAGYSISSMDINFLQDLPAKSYSHITVMPEIEYVLNNNIMNPTSFYFNLKYRSVKADYEEVYVRENWQHQVDYQSLLFSLGAKKYFLSSNNVKFYGKLGFGVDMPLKSEILSPSESWRLNPIFLDHIKGGINTGLGIKLYDSFLVEIDYDYIFNTLFMRKNTSINFKAGYSF